MRRIGLTLVACLAGGIVGCVAVGPGVVVPAPTATVRSLTRVSSAYSTTSASDLPLWLAREGGLFVQRGLDVNVQLMQNPATTAALLSGQIDVAFEGVSDVLGPVVSGADLIVLANLVPTPPYVFEVSPQINSAEDLRGAKIAASQAGGSDYVALQAVLRQIGVDPTRDVDIVFVGGVPDRTAALVNGSAVATLTAPPETLVLEARGFHPLVDLTSLHISSVNSGVVVQRAYARDHPDVIQAFMDALLQAIALQQRDRAQAETVMEKYLNVSDRAQLDATYDFWVKRMMPSVPRISSDQFTLAVDTLAQKDPAVRSIDVNRLVDSSFVEAAAQHVKTDSP